MGRAPGVYFRANESAWRPRRPDAVRPPLPVRRTPSSAHSLTPSTSSFPSSTAWETKFRESEAKRHELEALLEDTRLELDEFQTSSRELEEELEKDLERSEKAKQELENRVAKIDNEKDDWKVRIYSSFSLSPSPVCLLVIVTHL